VGERGTRLKRGEDVRRWPKIARSWARPQRGECGREVGDELTCGVDGTEREAGARARGTTPISLAHWAAGGREGENARARQTDRRGPPISASRCVGARGLGRLGLNGPNWVFLISGNF
jgi:hypothetical protein